MRIIYKNATIITCDNNFLIKNSTLVTEGEFITYIGDNYDKQVGKVVDCTGQVLMPGFININLHSQNICGITTTISDINNDLNNDVDLVNIDNLSATQVNDIVEKNSQKKMVLQLFDYISQESEYGELLKILFNKNLKLIVKAGASLDEMGLCDKYYNKTPIEYLESYGILDKENIILSCANLNKEDFEKISEYNNSVCLTLSEDLINGNGFPSMLTMEKYNLNMCLSTATNNMFKEMFLAFALPRGILNTVNALNYEQIIKMATINVAKAMCLTKLGMIKQGYYANFIALNINEPKDILKDIVECGGINKIEFVIKKGERINW